MVSSKECRRCLRAPPLLLTTARKGDILLMVNEGYDPNQPRDELGQWTDENGTSAKSGSILPGKGEEPEIEQTSGATSGAVDPDSERGQEHAERFYEEMRHRKDDISSIAKNTGFSKNDIEKIKNYIFFDEHDLSTGRGRFYPNCDMAHSWQRLIDGKGTDADVLMLKHELMECSLVKQGYSQSEAHNLTNKKYNYTEALSKIRKERNNGKIKKHKT